MDIQDFINQTISKLQGNLTETGGPQTPEHHQKTLTFNHDDLSEFLTFDEPTLLKAKDSAVAILNEMADPAASRRWLTLTGISGLGKTYLAKLMLKIHRKEIGPARRKAAMESISAHTRHVPSFDCYFCKWRDIVQELRSGNWGIVEDLKRVHFLVIDDIGTRTSPK